MNCAGLQSDLVAAADGVRHDVQIVPFRGEFHELVPSAAALVRHLIYPVPDPDLPFLGVHLSRGSTGASTSGPNAVLALRREGYSWSAVEARELRRLATFPGFWRMARQLLAGRRGRGLPVAQQARARARARAASSPASPTPISVPYPAGVRAQAVARDGTLLDDFVLRETPRAVHVLNAPSPAATASLVIGESIATRALERL